MTTILVVDDELCIAASLCALFELEGYRCVVAANGREGLALAEKELPAVVLVDVMMPVMDGREMVRRMREHARLADIPIVVMSAARGVLDGDDLAHDHFLEKPFSLDEVLGVVKAFTQDHAGRSSGETGPAGG